MSEHAIPRGRPWSHARYRLNCDTFDALVREAGSRCQICLRAADETGHQHLVVDHDPGVGDWAVRGLLCSPCNGAIEDAQRRSSAADAYLDNPWYVRMLAVRGLRPEPGVEPPLGATVRARRTWQRTETGWTAMDRYRGGQMNWLQIHRRFGPHNVEIVNE